MDKWEYIEDTFNMNEPHPKPSSIIKTRAVDGWINVSTGFKGDTAILRFKRKI